jgi:hypothetical protein
MKVMDRLGNELRPGDTVYFGQLQTIMVIMDVEEPGKIQETPGVLSLGFKMPFKLEKGKTDALFADLMKVHTPGEGASAEQQVNEILEGRGKAPVRVLDRKVR